MKKTTTLFTQTAIIAFLVMVIVFTIPCRSQIDTLHLNYHHTQNKMHDSTSARIDQWIKKLNGQHTDVHVVAYYHKADFKKYAEERADEYFIVLNRKARSLFTIESIESKKGKEYQKTMVDIIYKPTGGSDTPKEKDAAAKNKKEDIKKKDSDKSEATTKKSDKDKKGDTKTNEKTVGEKGKSDSKETSAKPAANKPFVVNDEFKSKKLMIALLAEDQEQIEKLKTNEKSDELDAYRNNIKNYNENITKAFTNSWKETSFELMSEKDLASVNLNEKAEGWVFLLPGRKQLEGVSFMTYKATMVYQKGKKSELFEKEFKVSLRNGMPDEGDFYLLMYKMKVFFNLQKEFNREQLDEIFAAKTLYVDTALTALTKEEFKENYPFPFMYTGGEEVAQQAKTRAKNSLYFKTDVLGDKINLMIVDAETASIISRCTLSGLTKVAVKMPDNKFGNNSSLRFGGKQLVLDFCTACAFANMEILRLYTAKAKVKKDMLKYLADEKKQIKFFTPLIIY